MENKCNLVEDISILTSIDETSADNNSNVESINTNAIYDIQDRSEVHPNISVRYARLKTRDRIRQT